MNRIAKLGRPKCPTSKVKTSSGSRIITICNFNKTQRRGKKPPAAYLQAEKVVFPTVEFQLTGDILYSTRVENY